MANKPVFNTTWLQSKKPENFDDPNHDLIYKRKVNDVPKIKTHITNSCTIAWNSITIDEKGRVFTCACDGHVPFPVGYVEDFNTFDEIFSSPQAQLTQQSILKKEFEYCATPQCGVETINKSYYEGSIYLAIQVDISCNLSCPSCRERLIFLNDKTILNEKFKLAERIHSWISSIDKKVIIEFAGGDPLASLVYLDMMELFSTSTNVKFQIRTNGLLLKTHFTKFDSKIKDKIHSMSISIDAASAETYELVRRGGKWDQLLNNLDYIKSSDIKNIKGNFVIQRDNINDIIPFVNFCKQYNLIPEFSVVEDWGTWHNFEEHCVHLPSSPYYTQFTKILTDPVFKENNVYIESLNNWL
jgi:organic radical activating enzyme